MLVLTRKLNENILIGDDIVVKVLKMGLESIRIGIQAPSDIPVHRQEIYEEIRSSNQQAVTEHGQALPKIKPKTRRTPRPVTEESHPHLRQNPQI
jgi:carbon storage regulator